MNFDVQDIKDENDYLLFFKIVENKYVDAITKNGQIYFSPLSAFRKMEKDEKKRTIGDQTEASLTHKVSEYIVCEDEVYEIHGKKSGYNIRIDNNQCVFCFYALGMKSFDKIPDNKIRHIIPWQIIEKMCKDKGGVENCSLIVFNDEVIHKIYSSLSEKRLKHAGSKVKYDDFDYVPGTEISSFEYSIEAAFHKKKEYAYQNEFRIVAVNDRNGPIQDLYICVEKDDFNVLNLKNDMDFCCDVTYRESQQKEENVCVEYNTISFLERISEK